MNQKLKRSICHTIAYDDMTFLQNRLQSTVHILIEIKGSYHGEQTTTDETFEAFWMFKGRQ